MKTLLVLSALSAAAVAQYPVKTSGYYFYNQFKMSVQSTWKNDHLSLIYNATDLIQATDAGSEVANVTAACMAEECTPCYAMSDRTAAWNQTAAGCIFNWFASLDASYQAELTVEYPFLFDFYTVQPYQKEKKSFMYGSGDMSGFDASFELFFSAEMLAIYSGLSATEKYSLVFFANYSSYFESEQEYYSFMMEKLESFGLECEFEPDMSVLAGFSEDVSFVTEFFFMIEMMSADIFLAIIKNKTLDASVYVEFRTELCAYYNTLDDEQKDLLHKCNPDFFTTFGECPVPTVLPETETTEAPAVETTLVPEEESCN